MEKREEIFRKHIIKKINEKKLLKQDEVDAVLDAMEEYAQYKVNELNKSDVKKSVCGCGYDGTYEKDGLIFCKCCDNRKI